MGVVRVGSCGVVVLVGWVMAGGALAQDEAETCYGPGSVVGAVVGTLIVTIGLLASGFFFYKLYWKSRKGKHLVLMTDVENPHDQYAFDNPCFREATPIKHVHEDKHTTKLEKSKWPGWPPIHTFGKDQKTEKITSMDDSCINDSRVKVVTLKGHDFTGLGFNICGNMRDGIFVKDILHRGPAFESGCINIGDRIDSVCISFRNMVFEDALTILSYASPYDVQVQLQSDSCSRPSTLMRSKRESNAVNCSDRILHPKFSRSQSVSHLNEFGNSNNKKMSHQMGFTLEKNRVNHSLNKSQDLGDYPTIKVSPGHKAKTQKPLPLVSSQKSPRSDREYESQQTKSVDGQNKLQKFGIKVLPMSINPKMGVQSVAGTKKTATEKSLEKEKPEKAVKPKELSRNTSPVDEKLSGAEEADGSKENMKGMLAKGLFSLKEKMNSNSLGKRRKGEEEGGGEGEGGGGGGGGECPAPRLRSSGASGVRGLEEGEGSRVSVPEEVFRAGDVARSHRRSVVEGRRGGEGVEGEGESGSEECSDRESVKDDTKRRKKSKGKAPSPPKPAVKEMNEIKRESDLVKDGASIFEPESKMIPLKDEDEEEEEEVEDNCLPSYDSDSDAEPMSIPKESPGTKIELNATQVTVHHSPAVDGNDEEVEPSRKAASLGDLSKLDSEQPLSIVLERAVSLDLTEGASQGGKKRKAPLPPSEEFPGAFDDLGYRKEPRLEGLNTFQRRLKKSSDFGTLEDALNDEPKPLEIEVSKLSPHNLSEAHNHNIQEFSSWLAECRRPKGSDEEAERSAMDRPKISSTSLVNINAEECPKEEAKPEGKYEFQGGNVSFRVNGRNFPDFELSSSTEVSPNSRTVVVISQPNSLEPVALEKQPEEPANGPKDPEDTVNPAPPKLPTTPVPTSNTLSSPLSSPLTYVTEIKVSTSEQTSPKPPPGTPSPSSVAERIHRFDPLKGLDPKTLSEVSKIPIKTMKSETGQRVLATIQSLAKESSAKAPEADYAKRVASLFSGPLHDADAPRPNVSGLYFKPSPPKPSKDYSPSKKVPPVVPPRKLDASLPTNPTVALGLPTPPPDAHERNVVTFSSFVNRTPTEDSAPPKISFSVKHQREMNGGQDGLVPVRTSSTKIVLEKDAEEEGF